MSAFAVVFETLQWVVIASMAARLAWYRERWDRQILINRIQQELFVALAEFGGMPQEQVKRMRDTMDGKAPASPANPMGGEAPKADA